MLVEIAETNQVQSLLVAISLVAAKSFRWRPCLCCIAAQEARTSNERRRKSMTALPLTLQ
jgi:hypothetical protein